MGSIERKMHRNLQKLLSFAKLIGTCKYLDTESFSHKLKRSTNRSLIQTFLAYLDKLNIPSPQGRFFGANSGEHHQRIKVHISLKLYAKPRKKLTKKQSYLTFKKRR
jgi:hypothetical protein